LFWRAARQRRAALAKLAGPVSQRRFGEVRAGARRWRGMLALSGVLYLAWACAGPRWGATTQANAAGGQDLAVVLDLSRSMQAEQPSRRERAVRALRHLADAFQKRGGRRVSLVVFAAQARLVFPLTQDYDHWRSVLSQIEVNDLPPLGNSADEPLASGTRIGAGLKLALASHDLQRAGRQAVLLVSDGDDPAGDEEWQQGVQEAKSLRVPIHVVGVGDPTEAATIPLGGDVLRFAGQPVRTRLDEAVLQEIARRSGGVYLPAPTGDLPLGTVLPPLLDSPQDDQEQAGDFADVQPRQAWFLLASLACLAGSLLVNEGPRRREIASPRLVAVVAALVALIVMGAGPADEDEIRRGNEAFAQQEYAQAIEHYAKAEAMALDPGLVAFNKGVAQYRLGRYAEAELSFRRCLDDDQAPARRRAAACFDLGNSLLRQGGDEGAAKLRLAVEAYRACLLQPELDADLRKDARHNLELAQLLWLQAKAKRPDDPEGTEPNPNPSRKDPAKSETKSGGDDPANPSKEPGDPKGDPNGVGPKDQGNLPQASKNVAQGPLQVLPDDDKVLPLSPQELHLRLRREADRIAAARRAWRVQQSTPHPVGKDW
jgi:Ca-activated chloride channel family protein